jgi:AGCS family alanine or glycine:cation symporter
MESFERIVNTLTYLMWSAGFPVGSETIPWIVVLLLGTGALLTVRLSFIQFRKLGHGFAVALGRYDDPSDPGDVSHFQALTTALSATVGIGNIAGVAIAIHWGGPGALFWMWVTAIFGMALKFGEVTLAQRYREVGDTVAGGPMYYIERGLGSGWKWLAVTFAVILGSTAFLNGNAVQANTVADSLSSAFGIPPWVSGLVTASLVAGVILGGIKRIGRVTAVLAPAMAGIYLLAALVIVAMNLGQVGPTLTLIFREAFNPSAGIAGTGVGAFLVTMMWGVRQGAFSNEAGQGSAPIAHAAAKTSEPVSEGVVGLVEPFIDTIVIITITAFVIISTGVWTERIETEIDLAGGDLTFVIPDSEGGFVQAPRGRIAVIEGRPLGGVGELTLAWHELPLTELFVDSAMAEPFTGTIREDGLAVTPGGLGYRSLYAPAVESGAPLTMLAFRRGLAPLGDWGHHVVLLCVLLFAVSTAIAWSYYGDRCALYLFGPRAVTPYRIASVGMHFLGAIFPLTIIWNLGSVFLGAVMVPNLIALILLNGKIRELSVSYFERKPWERS